MIEDANVRLSETPEPAAAKPTLCSYLHSSQLG